MASREGRHRRVVGDGEVPPPVRCAPPWRFAYARAIDAVLAYRCTPCGRNFAESELRTLAVAQTQMRVCPACGSAVFHEASRAAEPVTVPLLRALAWPFRPISLVTLAVVVVVSGLASYAPFGMWIAGGIRFGYLAAVLRAGSLGQDDVEIDPTQIGGALWEWSAPFVRFLFTAILSFGPAVLAASLLGPAGAIPAAILGLLGAVYFPAALIVAAHAEGFFAWLRPDLPIRLIAQIPRPYAVACGLLLALAGVSGGALAVANAIDVPVVSFLLSAVLGFVPLVAAARLLGVLVHENREDL